MKTLELINTVKDLSNTIKTLEKIKESKKEKYLNELSTISKEYENIKIAEKLKEVYTSLYKKGNELIKELNLDRDNKDNISKIEGYIRYLKAAKGDFEGNTNYVNKYFRSFIFTAILFLALSPQYFGFVLPAIFFVPIFLGVRGVKNRSINGLYMSLSVVPVALMTSFIWIRYGIYAFTNYQKAISDVIQATGRSVGLATALVTGPPVLAIILLTFAIMQAYRGYKSKDLFV